MKKIYILLAIAIAGMFIYSTTVYIPEGYAAVTMDGESLYSEGVHLFQKYPQEEIRLIKISEQCDTYEKDVMLNDGALVRTNIKVCWKIAKDLNQIKHLYMLYDHGIDSSDYRTLLIYPTVIPNAYKVFYRYNISTLDPYNLNASRDILDMTQRDLVDRGIIITEISVSLPSFGPFMEAIKKRDELKKQAENEVKRLRDEANRWEQIQKNTTNKTWINDVPENQADYFIQHTTEAFYARLIKEQVTGLVPTLSFSKGPSRYGVPGFVGIYNP